MADGKRGREDDDNVAPDPKRQQIGNLRQIILEDEEESVPGSHALAPPPARPLRAEPFGKRRIRVNQRKPAIRWEGLPVGGNAVLAQPQKDAPTSTTGATPQPSPNDKNSPPAASPRAPTPDALPKTTNKPLIAWETMTGKINKDETPTEYPSPGSRLTSISQKVPFWGTDVNRDRSLLGFKGTASERAAWLASEPKWLSFQRLGAGWKGIKVLGFGGYGMVGLWERGGDVMPKRMVVKQQAKYLDQFVEEGRYLQMMGKTGSKHVVRMFKRVFTERGQGTVKGFDEMGAVVGRMFLEYCEGGDFYGFVMSMYRKFSAQNPMPERLIWQVFKCLALGLAVIEHGNELGEGAESWKDEHEILHRDIKPANILVGSNDKDHLQMPIFKIADFGLAMEARKRQNEDYVDRWARRGTPGFFSPEINVRHDQYTAFAREKRLSNALDVWAMGKTMYYLICRGRDPGRINEFFFAKIRAQEWAEPTLTQGRDLLNAPYSSALRRLVLQCLAFDYALRPTPRQLVKIINDGIEAFDAVPMDDQFWPTSFDEPGDLDPNWFPEVKVAGPPPPIFGPPLPPANVFPFQFRPPELVQTIIDAILKMTLG